MDDAVHTSPWIKTIARAAMLMGLCLLGCMLPASFVYASPAVMGPPPEIEVLVDTSTLDPKLGERLQHELENEITAALREQGLAVVSRSEQARLEARIEMYDVELREYAISLDLLVHGKRRALIEKLVCTACTETLVVQQTLLLLPVASALIEAERACVPVVPPPPPPPPRRQPLSGVGIAGIGILSGGLGSLIGGAVAFNSAVTSVGGNKPAQTQGAALVGVGVAALLLGVTAVALDLTALERRRRQGRVEMQINASPTSAGLWVRGSF